MLTKSVVVVVYVFWCGLLFVDGSPWHKIQVRHGQACGDRLADIMSLVCSDRGYNLAFKPERSRTRRFRRGIVEECCRNTCEPAMLELYCRADPADEPSDVPIRKRSQDTEGSEIHREEKEPKKSMELENRKIAIGENQPETISTETKKDGEDNFKLLNLLAPHHKHNTKTSNKKLTPNDTTEEGFYHKSKYPPMRHKSHHHHSSRQLHNRKASTKSRRSKDLSAESTDTFQIGMVRPYFAGRALASYHTNFVPHPPRL